jgi:hypothetical protein
MASQDFVNRNGGGVPDNSNLLRDQGGVESSVALDSQFQRGAIPGQKDGFFKRNRVALAVVALTATQAVVQGTLAATHREHGKSLESTLNEFSWFARAFSTVVQARVADGLAYAGAGLGVVWGLKAAMFCCKSRKNTAIDDQVLLDGDGDSYQSTIDM